MLLVVLGLIALRFSVHLFRDVAPYRVDGEALARMRLTNAEIVGFGPWLTVGGAYSKYQRLMLRDPSGRTLQTPYVRLTQAIWLDIGDRAYLASAPSGVGPPLFLGVARTVPDVVARGSRVSSREYYEALQAHLSSDDIKRQERLLRLFGTGKR